MNLTPSLALLLLAPTLVAQEDVIVNSRDDGVGLGGGAGGIRGGRAPRHRDHPEEAVVLQGRIVDRAGQPVSGMVVVGACRHDDCEDPSPDTTRTDERGMFRVEGRWSMPKVEHHDRSVGSSPELECGWPCEVSRGGSGAELHKLRVGAGPLQLQWPGGERAPLLVIQDDRGRRYWEPHELELHEHTDLDRAKHQRGFRDGDHQVFAFVDGAWWHYRKLELPGQLGVHEAERPDVRPRRFLLADGGEPDWPVILR